LHYNHSTTQLVICTNTNIPNKYPPLKTPCPQGEDTVVAAGTSLPRWHYQHFLLSISPRLE